MAERVCSGVALSRDDRFADDVAELLRFLQDWLADGGRQEFRAHYKAKPIAALSQLLEDDLHLMAEVGPALSGAGFLVVSSARRARPQELPCYVPSNDG